MEDNCAEGADEDLSLSSSDTDSLSYVDTQTNAKHQDSNDKEKTRWGNSSGDPIHKNNGTGRLSHSPTLLGHLRVHPRTARKKHHLPPFFASGQNGYAKNTPWFPDDRHRLTALSHDKHENKTYKNIHGLTGIRATTSRMNTVQNGCQQHQLQPHEAATYYKTYGHRSTRTPLANYHPLPHHLAHSAGSDNATHLTKSPNYSDQVDLDSKTMEKLVSRISKRIIRRLEKRLEAKMDALLDSLLAVLGENEKADRVNVHA